MISFERLMTTASLLAVAIGGLMGGIALADHIAADQSREAQEYEQAESYDTTANVLGLLAISQYGASAAMAASVSIARRRITT